MGHTPSEIEQALIARANRGDREAVGRLYAMHAGWITQLALRYTGNLQDAEDVRHDTFVYFLSKFPGFSLRASMRGFLFPAVRHRSISVLRRRRRLRGLEAAAEPSIRPTPTNSDYERLVELLPAHERCVVELRYREGMRLAEIGKSLGIPLGTVKSRLHKAIARLRGQFARAA